MWVIILYDPAILISLISGADIYYAVIKYFLKQGTLLYSLHSWFRHINGRLSSVSNSIRISVSDQVLIIRRATLSDAGIALFIFIY